MASTPRARFVSLIDRYKRVNEKGRFRLLAIIHDSGKPRRIRLLKIALERGIPLNVEGALHYDDPDLVKLRKKGLIATKRI